MNQLNSKYPRECPPYYKLSHGTELADLLAKMELPWQFTNVLEYLFRAGKKTVDPREDLRKAIDWLWLHYRHGGRLLDSINESLFNKICLEMNFPFREEVCQYLWFYMHYGELLTELTDSIENAIAEWDRDSKI